jgi:hypothetical protein
MNFPDEPFFRFVYWIINTPSIGGLVVVLASGAMLISALVILYWVMRGAQADESDVYVYPTETLLGHDEAE